MELPLKQNIIVAVLFLLLSSCAEPVIATVTEAATITQAVIEIASTETPDLDIADYADPNGQAEWNFLVLGSDYREGDPARQIPHTDAFVLVNVREMNE